MLITTTIIIRLRRTWEEVLKVNDCTLANHSEFLLHHYPKVFQFSHNFLPCQLSVLELYLSMEWESAEDVDEKEKEKEKKGKKTHLHRKSISEK